jgi:small-conductance mechanosensitive channel
VGGDGRLWCGHADLFQEEKMVMKQAFATGLHRPKRPVWSIILAACLLLTCAAALPAAQGPPAQPQPVSYPGIEEFTPRATALAAEAVDADQKITEAEQSVDLEPQIKELQASLDKLEKQFTQWDQVADWPLSSLMEARSRYSELQRQQAALQKALSDPLKTLEEINRKWSAEQAFWNGWGEALRETWQKAMKNARVKAPRESFDQTVATIQSVLDRNARATNRMILFQQTFASQQALVASRGQLIETAMAELRKDIFRRNAPSLFAPEYYTQFNQDLIDEFRKNLETTLRSPVHFLSSQGWVILLQIAAGLAIGILLKIRQRQKRPITQELRFLFNHPWGGAIFLATVFLSGLYTNSPAIWRWLLFVTGTASATLLVVAMYRQMIIRRLIRATALIYVIAQTAQLVGLPRPAQQLYLIALCLVISLTCLALARKEGHDTEATRSGLTLMLYLGSGIGLIGLLAGMVGFVVFAASLVDAFIGTIMVVLCTNMAIRLADGGVLAFMKKDWVRGQRFVQRLGIQTTERIQTILHLVIYTNAFIYLFIVWNVYDSSREAWSGLLALEYAVGDFSISLKMVVLVALVIYLTTLFSWILQAFVDAQFLTPRGMAFGVRSAFKRLLHYALFTIGFFIAISMAGIGFEKFAIVAGALGVGIGFGLQNIVNNFISGLILLFERPIKVGDIISLEDQWGTVSKIGLRSTVVENFDRAEVIVPNADLIAQKVTNWTLTSTISRVILTVGVAYGSNLTRVLSILDTAGRAHPDVLSDPEPNAIFTGFGESSIDFELRVWISDINKRLSVKSELGQTIDSRFREAGISIPFPQRDLHLCSIDPNLQAMFGVPANRPSPETQESSEEALPNA